MFSLVVISGVDRYHLNIIYRIFTVNVTLNKAEPLPLSLRAYQELREKILNNELRPGRYFLERDLVELLDVSRTPLKEALVRLEQDGLLTIQPRHGIQVTSLSANDIADIYQIIISLEGEAVGTVARKGLSNEQRQQLWYFTIEMEQALARDDLEAWAKADENFYRRLLELSGSQYLTQAVLHHWDLSHRARYLTLRLIEKPLISISEHQALIEALDTGDIETAVLLHHQYRSAAGESLIKLIQQYGLDNL